jgi:hypothetical protein
MNNIEAFKTLKGQNVRVKWVRAVKVKKGQTVYFKETSGKFSAGIDYENMVKVQQGRDNGELPSENASLPWGHWMDFPYLIGHKGKTYVRLYPPSENRSIKENVKKSIPKVRFLTADGVEVSPEVVKAVALASEFPKEKTEALCFTVDADNIVEIGVAKE